MCIRDRNITVIKSLKTGEISIGSYKGETLWDYLVKAKKSEKKSI